MHELILTSETKQWGQLDLRNFKKSSWKSSCRRAALSLPLAAVLLGSLPVMGANINIMTNGTTFGTAANWSLASAPVGSANAGSYTDLLFNPAITALTNTSVHVYSESLNITNGSAYTISANAAGATDIRIGNNSATTDTTFVNAVSGAAQDVVFLTNNSSLTINPGNVGAGTPMTVVLRQAGNFNVANGSTLTVNAAIIGSVSITNTGGGTTILGGTNAYTGSTTVNAGTLRSATNNVLSTGALAVSAGGTLDLQTFSNTVAAVTMTGGSISGNGGTLNGSSYTMTGGAIGGNNMSVSANLVGAGALTMGGTNATLTLNGTNTYSGATTINNGSVQVNGVSALSGSSILKSGGSTSQNGTLNLGTADSGYTMNQLSLGGILYFTGPNSGSSTLTFTNGAIITGTSGKSLVIATNTTMVVNGSLFDLIGTQGLNNRALSLTVSGRMTINAPIQDKAATGTNSGLTKLGEGTLILNGTNSYTGATTISAGTLRVSSTNALSGGTLTTGVSVNDSTVLDLASPNSYSVSNLSLGGILRVIASGGASSLTFPSASLLTGTGSKVIDAGTNVTINVNGPLDLFGTQGPTNRNLNVQGAGNMVFNGNITNTDISGTYLGGLHKLGTGTVTLMAVNSYNGNTTIDSGTLALGVSASIASSTNISVASAAIFDVSAMGGGFVLGANHILSNNLNSTNTGSAAMLKGNLDATAGGVSLIFTNGFLAPCFTVTNGALTLSAATAFTVANTGTSLTAGSYKIISKTTGGSVTGTAPSSVTVQGNVVVPASLQIISGELYLNLGSTSSLVLTSSAQTNLSGAPVTFTAAVQTNSVLAGNATGTMVFETNGVALCTSNVVNGVAASLTVANLPAGTTVITAIYSGDNNYLPSTITLNQVVTNAVTLPGTGTNITFSAAGNLLTLSWPPSYTGWELQSNSVSLTSTNFWFLVPNSTATNQMIITVDPAKPNVFYRMHHP